MFEGIVKWVKANPNRTMFLAPIILVAGISISHVVAWYNIANPISWAIYLSLAIEIGAMTALVAATNKIKGGVWIMFGLITGIQMIGNIYFSYKEINANGELFKAWVELTAPLWDSIGSDSTDAIAMKRWLAFLEGGLLPIISLTSLHFFVKYDNGQTKEVVEEPVKSNLILEEEEHMMNKDNVINPTFEISKTINEYKESMEFDGVEPLVNENHYMDLQEVEKKKSKEIEEKVWGSVHKLRSEGVLPIHEEIEDEPTALAFTPYETSKTDENLDELDVNLDELLDWVDVIDTKNEDFTSRTEENLDELDVNLDEHLDEEDRLSDGIRSILEDEEMVDEDWNDWDDVDYSDDIEEIVDVEESEELIEEELNPIDNEQLFWENVEPSSEEKKEDYNPYENTKRLSYIKK
jgi:hypothetical protein